MICTRCHYWDALPNSDVCERCTPKDTNTSAAQWKRHAAQAREDADLILRELLRERETTRALSDLLREVAEERDALRAELNALKAMVQS